MSNQRKGWNQLSVGYRKRLQSNGITPAEYARGASLRGARGHRDTPESARYRRLAANSRVDVRGSVPNFEQLTKSEQEQLARAWVQGITSRARGPVNPKTGRRKPSAAQVRAKMDALDLITEHGSGYDEAGFWRQFRQEYNQSHNAAA